MGRLDQKELPSSSSPLSASLPILGAFSPGLMSSPPPASLYNSIKASPEASTGIGASPGSNTGIQASPGLSTGTKASPGIRMRASRAIGSAQKRRLLARMLMLSHATGSGSGSGPRVDSSSFAHNQSPSTHIASALKGKDQVVDESFVSVGSGGSGEVKVGLEEIIVGYPRQRGIASMSEMDMSQWNDDEGEMEEIDDGGDGWYEKAMEIIRQDALIQEQVLAATLL